MNTSIDISFRCNQCDFQTTKVNVIQAHLKQSGSLFDCFVCDKVFCTEQILEQHYQQDHDCTEERSEEIISGILFTIDIDRLILRVKSWWSIVMGYGQKFDYFGNSKTYVWYCFIIKLFKFSCTNFMILSEISIIKTWKTLKVRCHCTTAAWYQAMNTKPLLFDASSFAMWIVFNNQT